MSMSNPEHGVRMSNTKRSTLKEKRTWEENLNEKIRYIERLQQEKEAERRIKEWETPQDDEELPF